MSKTDGENAAVKKKVFTEIWTDFPAESDLQKKRSSPKFRLLGLPLRFRLHFSYSMQFGWAPSRAHGPRKHHGLRGHCPPLPPPPSRRPFSDFIISFNSEKYFSFSFK